jgi:uncharacterized membrane protein SpoIIM required for sporulation
MIVFFIVAVALPLLFAKLIKPQQLLQKPVWAAITAGFFVVMSFTASFLIFFSFMSIAMVALATMLILPYLVDIFSRNYYHTQGVKGLLAPLRKYERYISLYTWMFFGMSLVWALLYAVMPPVLGDEAFSVQLSFLNPMPAFIQPDIALSIFVNNIQLALFAFALSPFWGAGSLFILGYIASLAAVIYGSPLRALIYNVPSMNVSLLFLPHTILEILGYLFAAVAGIALVKKIDKESLIDASWLLTVSIILIAFGAIIESGLI